MQVDFYHLTALPLDRVLPRITERVLAAGGRLLIVSADAAQRSATDKLLWSYSAESFLPHAQAGGGGEALQPVLIAADPSPANDARNVALVDGVWRDAALGFDRTFHIFSDATIDGAREAWRGLKDRADVERRYWRQSDAGRWEQVA